MTEREQHETSLGSTGRGGYCGRVPSAATLVAVVLLVCLLTVSLAGTAAAQSTGTIITCDGLTGFPEGSDMLQDDTEYDVTEDLEADRNDFEGASGDPPCIQFGGVSNVVINGGGKKVFEGNTRDDRGDGIFADFDASSNEISNIDVVDVGGSGIGVDGGDNSFSDITIDNPNDNGITETSTASGNSYTDISVSGGTNGIDAETGVFTNVSVTGSSGDAVVAGSGATLNRLELDSGQVTVPNAVEIVINPESNPTAPPEGPNGSATDLGTYVDLTLANDGTGFNQVGNLRLFYNPNDLAEGETATAWGDFGDGWERLDSTTGTVNGEDYVEVTETLGDTGGTGSGFEPVVVGVFGTNMPRPDRITDTTVDTDPVKYTRSTEITATLVDQFGEPIDPQSGAGSTDFVGFTTDGEGELDSISNSDSVSPDGGLSDRYRPTIKDNGDTVNVTVGETSQLDADIEPDSVEFDVLGINLDFGPSGTPPFEPADGGSLNEVQLTGTLTHQNGDPIGGRFDSEDIDFTLVNGEGTLSTSQDSTDEDGKVSVTYTVGEGDWNSDVVVEANVTRANISDRTTFGVQEPETLLDVTAGDSEILPTGTTDITSAAAYEPPFDTPQEDETVTFSTDGDGQIDGSAPPVDVQTDASGEATVTYAATLSDSGNDITVTGQGTDDTDSATFSVQDAEIDVGADLGVTAPEDGFGVGVRIGVVDSGGEVVESGLVDDTVTLGAGDSTLSNSGDSTTYSVRAIESDQQYRVTVSADGYEDTSATGSVAPGETGSIDAGTLAAKDVQISAAAALEVRALDGTNATFTLEDPGGAEVQTATDESIDGTASVGFDPVSALDFSESYTVTVDVDGYETDGVEGDTDGVPGAEESVDIGELEAENATVTADVRLEAEPGEATQAELELFNEDMGAVVDTVQPPELGADETETEEVTLTANFSEDDTSTGNYTLRANVTDGNTAYGADETDAGELAPGTDAESTQELFLDADPATVTAEAELETSPNVGTTVTFELINEAGEVIETETGDVNSSGTDAGAVTLTADFSRGDVDSGPYTVAAGVTGGDDRYNDDETGTGEIHPGDTVLVEDLLLGAVDCIDSRSVSRGQEDEECPRDRAIERGESRDELDRETGRRSETRRRDRSRGEGRSRGR